MTPTRAAKHPRGRPRTEANTLLVQALIGRQDAMSQRTARKITEILSAYIPVATVEILWREQCRQARMVLGAIPDRAVAQIAISDPGTLHKYLSEAIRTALEELAGGADDGAPLPELPPAETPPVVRRSHTLAEARAQCANLQTYLMDLKGRIVPSWRSRP
jgi:hypothetical protein